MYFPSISRDGKKGVFDKWIESGARIDYTVICMIKVDIDALR